MKQRDTYEGSDAPFQGNVILRLRSIPVNARVTKVTATITPVSDKGGPEPFTELMDISGATGDLGTTKSTPGGWVEVDFHARRTLAKVDGSNLTKAGVQVDLGGGAYVALNQVGGFKGAPTDTDFPMPGANEDSLPALTVNKLKLTPDPSATTNPVPDITTVTIRSVPSNLSLRIGDLAPFWTHVGEMPLAETTPDFSAVLQNFLAKASTENGSYIVPFTIHSDTLARLRIDLDIEQVSQASAIPAGLKEVVQPFDFSSVPQPQADVLQVELPANARVVSELSSAKVKGGFEPTRVVHGPTGPVSPGGVVEVSSAATLAQPFTISDPTGVTGIDLLISCSDPTVSLQADIRADLSGKPDNPPLFRGPVDLSLEKKSGLNQSFWASVTLPAEFHLEQNTYWLVLQSLNGSATWSVTSPDSASKAVMQRSLDGGFSWRVATPQLQASGPAPVSGPLAAFFRLRRKPDQFQVPIDLLVGSAPNAARIKLDRFAALGRVDFAPTDEVTSGFTQYFSNVAGSSSHSCPQGEQLANGNLEQWSVVAGGSGTVLPIDFGDISNDGGISVVVSPNGAFAYLGVSMDGIPEIEVIDVLCDQLVRNSELDLHNFGDPLLAVAPNSSRLYATISGDGNRIHVVDITGAAPAQIGSSVDTTTFTTGLKPVGVAVSPDSSRFYFVGQNISSPPQPDELLIFGTTSLEQAARGIKLQPPDILQIKSAKLVGLAISGDGGRLYVAVANASVAGVSKQQIWVFDSNAANGPLQTIDVTCQPAAITLTPDGSRAIVVGPQSSATGSPSVLSIIELANQVSTDVTFGGVPTSLVVSPDGQRVFIGGSADPKGTGGAAAKGSITVVDVNRGRIVQTIGIDGVPTAVAISPQGDRLYVAIDTSTGSNKSLPINVIALGSRVPAEWTLTAGSITPFCLSGDLEVVALIGQSATSPAPALPANGLSQVVPAAACTYDFSFFGLSDLDGSIGEALWLDQSGQSLKADQLPIRTWIQPSLGSGSSIAPPPPSPTFEETVASTQPPVLHRSRLSAPAGTVQVEVRFTVPAGGLAAVGMVSLSGTSAVTTNSDLQILEDGVPEGWTLTPKGAAVSISQVAGGIEIQNGGAAAAELVQTSSLQAGQRFTVQIAGRVVRRPQAQQNPSIELHWLKNDGSASAPAAVFEIQPQDFDHLAGGDTVPKDTDRAEVHVVIPPGTTLTIGQLSVEALQTTSVPVSFIAQSPGELTISDLRVGYEKIAPPNPPIPSGGLAPPTPPNKNPGQPASGCHCPCCGDDTELSGAASVKTIAGKPAAVGKCITCGTTLVRLGGPLVPGAPLFALPTLNGAPKARPASGSRAVGPGLAAPMIQPALTAIPGVGTVREQQLRKAGIYSVRDLAAAEPEVIAGTLTGVSIANAPHFINEARLLLQTSSRAGVVRVNGHTKRRSPNSSDL